MSKKFKKFLNKVIKTIKLPAMRILPGQLAFFFVLSIIPLIALIGSFGFMFSISMENVKELIIDSFPKSTANLIIPIISGKGVDFSMIVFFATSFLLASNGTHSMILAANRIEDIEDSDYLKRRIKAILMTFILVGLLVFVLLVPAFGDSILKLLISVFNASGKKIAHLIISVYSILKYPLSFLMIYIGIKLLYTIAPDKKILSKSTTTGALFTSITWVLVTEIYSTYVEFFVHYDIFYGSISNILILLIWVYILAYLFVFGMALNNAGEKE
ncbi:MAG: YihY/virulence factor BrkB family protein [Bacilli bacterium]